MMKSVADKTTSGLKPSKFDRATFVSRIFSFWVFGLIIRGFRGELKLADLGRCPEHDASNLLADKLEKQWNRELAKKNPSLAWATARALSSPMVPMTLVIVLKESLIGLVQPLFLANLIGFFTNPTGYHYSYAWANAAAVVGLNWLYPLLHHPISFYSTDVAIRARVSWVTLIYRKALRLNMTAFNKTTVGQILNLMSNDVMRFDAFIYMFGYLIAGPILTVIGTYICYLYMGNVALIGLAVMMALLPLNYFTGKFVQHYQDKITVLTDLRVNLMNEIIKFMRTIKMYAWEDHFAKLISDARKNEMEKISISFRYFVAYISLALLTPRIILFAMFVAYVLLGGTLNADKVFVVMAVINTVTNTMADFVPDGIANFYQLTVSARRIQNYLMLEEIGEHSKKQFQQNDSLVKHPVVFNNVSTKWDLYQDNLTLNTITFELNQGELLAVIGTVGSGKSTLLMTMLNESNIVAGTVEIGGRVAYASQEPWCFHESVEQNILFGKVMDRNKFDQVIEVCALRKDLEGLPYGAKTLIGERGVILSGGQKARITLARALYSDADIYLLDDPLSAVDAEVANHIFERCIQQYLRGKTVVLVTHQVQFIKNASKVLVLEQGKPVAYGTYDHVLCTGVNLIEFIQQQAGQSDNECKNQEKQLNEQMKRQLSQAASEKSASEEFVPTIAEETMESGVVNSKLYLKYFTSGKAPLLLLTIIVFMVVTQVLYHVTDLWLTAWINLNDANQKIDMNYYLIVYSVLVCAHFVASFIRNFTYFRLCILSSVALHNSIFYSLMRAPIYFFDTNPTGRILNRFTKDLGAIDLSMPHDSFELFVILFEVIGAIVVVCLAKWFMIFPAIVLFVSIFAVRVFYIRAARNLKRFEAIVRSPLYSHTTLTLSGLSTIRAFKVQPTFAQKFYQIQDNHSSVYFINYAVIRLMSNLLDMLCQLYIVSVVLFLVIFYEGIEGGTAGLALTMVFSLTGKAPYGVRQSTEFETQMTSVERIDEYSHLKSEAPLRSNHSFPEKWPLKGEISFDQATLKYEGGNKPVLKNLCFTVNGGEKVSIVGRTGAGKSSILAALFRMVELADGCVTIDGVDCATMGLHELRGAMSIIPQEPMAFVGTLRANLDPFDQHTDHEVWQALDNVQLKNAVNEMPGQLAYRLSESGGNLSLGQRQLICLARALLRKKQILVLDEATANVDHQTDELIQKTIRKCFAACTVITIAHRLNTIIDSDRILVLDSGRVMQFDTPANLLEDKSGIFHNLVQQTGPEMAAKLTQIARVNSQ